MTSIFTCLLIEWHLAVYNEDVIQCSKDYACRAHATHRHTCIDLLVKYMICLLCFCPADCCNINNIKTIASMLHNKVSFSL